MPIDPRDVLPDALDSVARIRVRTTTGSDVGARRRLRFVGGSGMTVSAMDDPINEEIVITISGTGSAPFTRNTTTGDRRVTTTGDVRIVT